ncbi:MAG TPA: 50S ribosomal protein L23 [Candidatus Methanoculleus thermohydrogenotrophicum]|jgi:large subunit ribosomal protein L23|nr:50S ribosomal protein L23 [Candidatus Methanoculleus thermohydrogenotrophicum]NLM81712.1 50S ribosomal protein L23 [Candidatus Methanoculleus thermohydrogenotrophicum]HOB17852.1 50S ribosomal protein L23 [Candidatus Methanoculleus thermohydrogenotrophicum]HPZ37377.1 50S ribosomal protein L23 [Candidatus Methanoculleus thermohydrogenotrophicum]HQC91249.1 50S ribosomal protein L23 [Candidatus Methanoculleus thermohydrogenotrophicum]
MILKYPFVTEKAAMMLEGENKLQFVVDRDATKRDIKLELESVFEQEVSEVRTMMTMKGEKKAIIRFADEKAAEEILSRLGIM